MSTVVKHYRVDISIGDEVHSYFTESEPWWESQSVSLADVTHEVQVLCLVPENGTSRGKVNRFPLHRVISINDD